MSSPLLAKESTTSRYVLASFLRGMSKNSVKKERKKHRNKQYGDILALRHACVSLSEQQPRPGS